MALPLLSCRRHVRILIMTCLLLPLLFIGVYADPDSTDNEPSADYIFFTGYLNFDTVQDTLKGYVSDDLQYVPSLICWGNNDTLAVTRKKSGKQTRLKLPPWRDILISCAVEDVNLDTLQDIIFYIRGKSDDTTKRQRQFRALVLFGQNGLDSIKKVNLGGITESFQQTPFFAMDLRKGVELNRGAKRDPTRKESYVLNKAYRSVKRDPAQDSSRIVKAEEQTSDIIAPVISVFPNPAMQATKLQIKKLLPGDYLVQMYSVNGMQYHQQGITVDESGEVLRLLDLNNVPSGYYVVQLYKESTLIGSYPVVVAR